MVNYNPQHMETIEVVMRNERMLLHALCVEKEITDRGWLRVTLEGAGFHHSTFEVEWPEPIPCTWEGASLVLKALEDTVVEYVKEARAVKGREKPRDDFWLLSDDDRHGPKVFTWVDGPVRTRIQLDKDRDLVVEANGDRGRRIFRFVIDKGALAALIAADRERRGAAWPG